MVNRSVTAPQLNEAGWPLKKSVFPFYSCHIVRHLYNIWKTLGAIVVLSLCR